MFKIGRITYTRHTSYNKVKHFISNQILLTNDDYIPSIRDLSMMLDIPKSCVSKAILMLSEQDHWLRRISKGNSPRNVVYKIIATPDQAEEYKNYFLMPQRKKLKFRKMMQDVGQLEKKGQNHGRANIYSLISVRGVG